MKWTLLTMIGLGGVVTASPAPARRVLLLVFTISCPTKTINNIEANVRSHRFRIQNETLRQIQV